MLQESCYKRKLGHLAISAFEELALAACECLKGRKKKRTRRAQVRAEEAQGEEKRFFREVASS